MKMLTLTATLLCIAASGAFAKGHNQGDTEVPGMDVGTGTVATAQILGGVKGNRPDDKGPMGDNPATTNAGR